MDYEPSEDPLLAYSGVAASEPPRAEPPDVRRNHAVDRADIRDLRVYFRSRIQAGAVDDLVQESVLAALHGFPNAPREVQFRPYLFGVARFKLLRYLQLLRERPSVQASEEPRCHDRPPEARIDVESTLRRMPPDLQLVIHMTYWGGLSPLEISDSLSLPLPTVYTRLRRAKQRLARMLRAEP
jgi:RNA polymerase sigma factor (sigma-70 family)